MSKTLIKIAQQLKDANRKVQLIYAFNGVGKTRLSREFKELIAPKFEDGEEAKVRRAKVLYYNAFTEDLFYWDNDLEGDAERKLKIQPNAYTQWVLQEQGQDQNAISHFQHYTSDKLTPHFSADFSEVTFSFERGNDERTENIKISKGEESNFIWSIFYSLIEQVIDELNIPEPGERATDQYDPLEYIFIDDPVSSLDENHLIELAVNLAALIKSSDFTNGQGLKFIISTHNPLFYNVLYNELKVKSGMILRKNEDGTFDLEEKKGDSNHSFSYHLYLKQLIEQAIADNSIQKYHFTLLRNLYEKTASFLGYPSWSELLPDNKQTYFNRIIQFTSHSTLSNEAVAEPSGPEKNTVALLLNHLVTNYGFWQQAEIKENANGSAL
ncbi:MAG: anticodon nuclease [Chlorobium sp.]|nr:MAG: anticodon nuclease [Chlorobium sp.]